MINKITFLGLLAIVLFSCTKDEKEPEVPIVSESRKIFIGNEGNYGANNADISYVDEAGAIRNDVYQTIHGMPLGDVLQSISLEGTMLYAVLNNSNKIVVVNASDYANLHTIEGVDYPRYVHHVSASRAYVSSGSGPGSVYPMDKTNHTLGAPIAVGNGPENMVSSNNQLYICNSGGWGFDNTVSVINLDTDMVTSTIEVSDIPVDAVSDANGDIWVLCKGQTLYDDTWTVIGHSDARLYHIDELTNEVIGYFTVGDNGDHPYSMSISNDGQQLYIANGDLYRMSILDSVPTVMVEGSFGTVDVSSRNGNLWVTSVSDFVNPSMVYQYNGSGNLVSQFTAGIGANSVVAQ